MRERRCDIDPNQILALVGAALLAFVVRAFNVVLEWLARVLGVEPVEPIPTPDDDVTPPA